MNLGVGQRQALADKIRSDHEQSTRRKRIVAMIFVVLGVFVCLALLAFLQMNKNSAGGDALAPQNATDSYGFTLTTELFTGEASENEEPAEVIVFEDFLCGSCKLFHEQSSEFLHEQLESGAITLTYQPFAFLVNQSTDEYAQRAANAAVCVADEAGVAAYAKMHDSLMTEQPEQGGPGLSDKKLIKLAKKAGAPEASECIEERTFEPWLEEAKRAAVAADVQETPTVRINNQTVVRTDNGVESMPGPYEIEFAIEATS